MQIYTDGSCRKHNRGGWGVAVYEGDDLVHVAAAQTEDTTNNREELKGLMYGIRYGLNTPVDTFVEVYTDSSYCCNTYNDWIEGWYAKGWKNASNQTPANLDLIKELYELKIEVEQSFRVPFEIKKVKGHVGDIGNEVADKLATGAMNPLDFEINL